MSIKNIVLIKRLKIRSQFQIIIGIFVLLIIASSGIITFESLKKSLLKDYYESEHPLIILRSAQSNLHVKLEKAIETSELLATDPTLISWFISNDSSLNHKELSLAKIDNIFKEHNYQTVFAINASTLNYWSENYHLRETISKEDKNDEWFFKAINGGVKTTFDFGYNKELNEVQLFVDVLMYHQDSIIGIAGVGLSPTALLDEINKHKPSESSTIWVINSKGKVLVSSNMEDVNLLIDKCLPSKALEDVLSNNNSGILTDKLNNKLSEIAYLRVGDSEYKIVMQTPQEDLFPILLILKSKTFWFSVIFLVLLLIVISVLTKKITTPLHRLQQLTNKFAEGDLNLKMDDELMIRNDEIGSLSGSFNSMKLQLTEYIQRVNDANIALESEKEQIKMTNEQLSEALLKASESERLTQSFLANISHEIRTPMNGILGFAQLLEYDDLEYEEYKKYASHVVRGSHQLLEILDSIINLSKIESGVVKPLFKELNIKELLRETYELYKVLAEKKGLVMQLEIDNHACDYHVVTDRSLFQLVLNNLVSNAIKYTNKGFVTLTCKCSENEVELHVVDTGIGIAKEDMETIFKPFRQVQMFQPEMNNGAGLGLAIVSKVMQLLKGTVDVKSKIGEGTVFIVTMPLTKVI